MKNDFSPLTHSDHVGKRMLCLHLFSGCTTGHAYKQLHPGLQAYARNGDGVNIYLGKLPYEFLCVLRFSMCSIVVDVSTVWTMIAKISLDIYDVVKMSASDGPSSWQTAMSGCHTYPCFR